MRDKVKYFNTIEKDIVSNIYNEGIEDGLSYFDKFIEIAKNYKDIEATSNFINRCVMANDAESLVYLVIANKIIKYDDKLFNVINNEIKEELSSKLSLDIIRILINNKFVDFAYLIMTPSLYYKVHFLEDLSFLNEEQGILYLFGKDNLPTYFINQFNDFDLESDKKIILERLILMYGALLDEVPKYYHSHINKDTLILEFPSDINKRAKRVEFTFIDLKKLIYKGEEITNLIKIEEKIKKLVRKEK